MGYILGIAAIALGCKAFTPSGLPLAPGANITGIPAMLTGVFCVLLGIGICAFAAMGDYVLYVRPQ